MLRYLNMPLPTSGIYYIDFVFRAFINTFGTSGRVGL